MRVADLRGPGWQIEDGVHGLHHALAALLRSALHSTIGMLLHAVQRQGDAISRLWPEALVCKAEHESRLKHDTEEQQRAA